MATVVNPNDKLTFVITEYGIDRIAKALVDNTVSLNLFKMKVGDSNNSYYTPSETQTSLVRELPNGSFYISEKSLLEDGVTVSLKTTFPEDFSDCEIREVGLYETIGGVDYLFAVSTCQPIVKPKYDLKYLISVDYYIFLKSNKLSAVYDQIDISSSSASVTEEDLDDLMSTIMFTEGNLMEQINGNSRVIGYNRAQQLYERMEEDKKEYGYITSYNNFSSLLDFTNVDDIYSYWVFDYPRRSAPNASIVDLSFFNRNLSCNRTITSYAKSYTGFTPMLSFSDTDNFMVAQNDFVVGYDSSSFSKIGNIKVSSLGVASNYLESTNYVATTSTLDLSNPFELTGSVNLNGIQGTLVANDKFKFVVNENNDGIGSTAPSEDDSISKIHVSLYCGESLYYRAITPISSKVRYYFKIIFTGDYFQVHWSSSDEKLEEEATLLQFCTEPGDVEITGTNTSTKVVASTSGGSNKQVFFGSGIDGKGAIDGSFYLTSVSVLIDGTNVMSGSRVILENDVSFVDESTNEDKDFSMVFALAPITKGVTRTLLARSNYSLDSHVFEVKEVSGAKGNKLYIRLFTDSNNYVTYETAEGTVPNDEHVIVLSYRAEDKTIEVVINGVRVNAVREVTGTYTSMRNPSPSIYAYSTTPVYKVFTRPLNSGTTQAMLCNADGSPYNGRANWSLPNNSIPHYAGNEASVTGVTGATANLVPWTYNDGLGNMKTVYTTSREITKSTTILNYDYSEYKGSEFHIDSLGRMLYKEEVVTDSTTSLYAWSYTDAANEAHTIYTITQNVSNNTVLYNVDYSRYVGVDFSKVSEQGVVKIKFNENDTVYGGRVGASLTTTEYSYTGSTATIWANSATTPEILFTSDGIKYSGNEWAIVGGHVRYLLTGANAEYNSDYDITRPALNLLSYIVDENGNTKDNIDSKIGIVGVVKSYIEPSKMRVLSLQIMSSMGKNPCITTY